MLSLSCHKITADFIIAGLPVRCMAYDEGFEEAVDGLEDGSPVYTLAAEPVDGVSGDRLADEVLKRISGFVVDDMTRYDVGHADISDDDTAYNQVYTFRPYVEVDPKIEQFLAVLEKQQDWELSADEAVEEEFFYVAASNEDEFSISLVDTSTYGQDLDTYSIGVLDRMKEYLEADEAVATVEDELFPGIGRPVVEEAAVDD